MSLSPTSANVVKRRVFLIPNVKNGTGTIEDILETVMIIALREKSTFSATCVLSASMDTPLISISAALLSISTRTLA